MVAERLVDVLRPNCVDACVAGADAIIDGALPTCTITQEVDGVSHRVATCGHEDDGSWSLPDGEDLCVYAVTGDELHPTCQRNSRNVELRYLRAPGVSLGQVRTTCEVSDDPAVACR